MDQNFNYYSVNDFHGSHEINECSSDKKTFSALNCNIRSLTANYDKLLHMLSRLNFPFSVIGLSEIKFRVDRDHFANINIPGYQFVSEPSLSNSGGVGFYICDNLNYSIRYDITISNNDFEGISIEVITTGQPTILCGVLYRHPTSNLDNFMNYINSTIEKINREEKLCLLMVISILKLLGKLVSIRLL